MHPAPADTLLVIEVADSSLAYDREIKLPLYVLTAVPEVWFVELAADVVEAYSDPAPGG